MDEVSSWAVPSLSKWGMKVWCPLVAALFVEMLSTHWVALALPLEKQYSRGEC